VAACSETNLKPVAFREFDTPDVKLGLPATFTDLQNITVGSGGMMGYDATNDVAFLVYRRTPPGANVTADEASIRTSIALEGTLTNPTTQTFTTWDTYNGLEAFYDQATTARTTKGHANALANRLVGAGAGVLTNTGSNNT
jgi:hypothetical protein